MKAWRPFEEAGEFARSLKLRNQREWHQYCKYGKDGIPKPNDIPSSTDKIYKNNGWNGWIDWLGNEDRIISEETRRNISKAKKGRKLSEETRRNMSKAQKGRIISEETRRKMSEWQKGRKFSDETKRKISETRKGKFAGEKHPLYGSTIQMILRER